MPLAVWGGGLTPRSHPDGGGSNTFDSCPAGAAGHASPPSPQTRAVTPAAEQYVDGPLRWVGPVALPRESRGRPPQRGTRHGDTSSSLAPGTLSDCRAPHRQPSPPLPVCARLATGAAPFSQQGHCWGGGGRGWRRGLPAPMPHPLFVRMMPTLVDVLGGGWYQVVGEGLTLPTDSRGRGCARLTASPLCVLYQTRSRHAAVEAAGLACSDSIPAGGHCRCDNLPSAVATCPSRLAGQSGEGAC